MHKYAALLTLMPLAVAIPIIATAADVAPAMSPGMWEVTRNMGKRKDTSKKCVTAAALAANPLAVFAPAGKPRCTNSEVAMGSGQLSYVMSCSGPMGVKIKGQMRGTYTADSFNMNSNISAMGRSMAITSTGKRVGECTGK